jgi:hypothetical protein
MKTRGIALIEPVASLLIDNFQYGLSIGYRKFLSFHLNLNFNNYNFKELIIITIQLSFKSCSMSVDSTLPGA